MPATKIDFKRELREFYTPGREPELVDVPELRDDLDYGVMPLDGHVMGARHGRVHDRGQVGLGLDGDDHAARTGQRRGVRTARAAAAKKKPTLEALRRVRLERFAEGPAAQMLYRGPTRTRARRSVGAFIAEQGYERRQASRDLPQRPQPHRAREVQDDHPPGHRSRLTGDCASSCAPAGCCRPASLIQRGLIICAVPIATTRLRTELRVARSRASTATPGPG